MNDTTYNKIRNLHRDFGYFFVGLLIAFAISGIAQNHRESWDPDKYVFSSVPVETDLNTYPKDSINQEVIIALAEKNKISSRLKFIRPEGDNLRAFFEQGVLDIDLKTGKGKFEILETRPFIGHLTKMHRSTNSWWIWYSDIFALGIITIALTGTFMVRGQNSFRRRGLRFTVIGIVIPLAALLFLL